MIQRLVKKKAVLAKSGLKSIRRAPLPFMSAGWVLWLEMSKDHEGVKCCAFGNETPKSCVVQLKMLV